MNEVVPWSARAREVTTQRVERIGVALARAWDWFTDLGPGSWLLVGTLVVAIALGVAVYEGQHDRGATPCLRAAPVQGRMEALAEDSAPLTAHQADTVHLVSTELTAIAGTAFGSEADALQGLARAAGRARVGHVFHDDGAQTSYDAVCFFRR